jgi:hypothetical protein
MASDGVTYPSLNVTTRITAGADFMYDSGHSKGTYFDTEIVYKLGIKVNADGTIQFIRAYEEIEHPSGIDVNGWSQFCSCGEIGSVVKDMKNWMSNVVKEYNKAAENNFLRGYNTYCDWVMPGNRTFTFKDEGFSDGMDFYTYINYIQED